MRVARLELRNWRNFTAVTIPLQPRTFLVGPNASGKSNLLDALRFLKELSEDGGGLQRAAAERRGGLKAIRSLHARDKTDVEIRVDLAMDDGSTLSYELVLAETRGRVPVVRRERFVRLQALPVETEERDATKEDEEEQKQTWLEQRSKNKRFRDLVQFLASIEYSHVVPQVVREQRRPPEGSRRHDPYGSDLIEDMATTPKKAREKRLKIINGCLAGVLPNLVAVDVDRDAAGHPHLLGRYKHWRKPTARQGEDQFSDGTLRLVGLLWSLTGAGGPILLEEPEISLHEHAVRILPAVLHRAAEHSKRQIIVSTHSEAMLNDPGIDPREIVQLEATHAATNVRLGSDITVLRELAAAGQPFGTELVGMTRPPDVQLLLPRFGR